MRNKGREHSFKLLPLHVWTALLGAGFFNVLIEQIPWTALYEIEGKKSDICIMNCHETKSV
jgi:hypothetical protein